MLWTWWSPDSHRPSPQEATKPRAGDSLEPPGLRWGSPGRRQGRPEGSRGEPWSPEASAHLGGSASPGRDDGAPGVPLRDCLPELTLMSLSSCLEPPGTLPFASFSPNHLPPPQYKSHSHSQGCASTTGWSRRTQCALHPLLSLSPAPVAVDSKDFGSQMGKPQLRGTLPLPRETCTGKVAMQTLRPPVGPWVPPALLPHMPAAASSMQGGSPGNLLGPLQSQVLKALAPPLPPGFLFLVYSRWDFWSSSLSLSYPFVSIILFFKYKSNTCPLKNPYFRSTLEPLLPSTPGHLLQLIRRTGVLVMGNLR